ncbi:MAG: hypothetical protein II561_10565 [Thermoguttaceae bacterium]|nr:hypothetical protein [Thermoguttaceae bacterium]
MSCVIDGEEIDAMSAGSRRYRTFAGIALAVAVLAFWECRILSADEPNGSATAELFGDLNFSKGFTVLDASRTLGVLRLPVPGLDAAPEQNAVPTWKIAQHNSKYDLTKGKINVAANLSESVTPGQRLALERNADGELVLYLDVSTDKEYAAPRKNGEPWIHLLLVRDFPPEERVSFSDAESIVFSCDARVCDWKRLMTDGEFNSSVHATQASVYFAISNDSTDSPDYRDYIWFGVSFFDDRAEVQEQYVEVDGDPRTIGTGKLIYRLGDQKTIDDVMSGVNPYSKQWAHIEIDLVQYVTEALKTAKERGFMTHTDVGDLKLAHFNYGWETPGTYSASLAIKNLRLEATVKK